MKKAKNHNEESLKIEIPDSGKEARFTRHYVEFDDKKVFYKDVLAVSFHSVKHSLNFIPTSQTYNFYIASNEERISFDFSSLFYIGNKNNQDVWYKLIGLYQNLIEPFLINNLLRMIFEKGETVHIGEVSFDKEGFHRSKLFGGTESVFWNERIYEPQISEGKILLFKDKDGECKQFKSISMEDKNAVALPALVIACVHTYAQLKK